MSINKLHLCDGSPLLLIELPHSYATCIMAMVHAGPSFDPPGKDGLSHLVEHMLFKGTQKWVNSYELTLAIEQYGGIAQAFSYYEANRYWIQIANEKVKVGIENLIQRVYFPLFKEEDIKTEKKVVKEEYQILMSNPEKLIWDLWNQTIWSEQQLGRLYIGVPETLDRLTQKDIITFFQQMYQPLNIAYVVAGNIENQSISDFFNEYVSNRAAAIEKKNFIHFPKTEIDKKVLIKVHSLDTENITIAMGFKTCSYSSYDKYTLDIISSILGGGMMSRLHQRVAEPGYTYSIDTYTEYLSEDGYLMVQFTTSKKYIYKVIASLTEEFEKFKHELIDEKELSLAKGYLFGVSKLTIETSYDWAKFYGDQLIYRSDILDLDTKVKYWDLVTVNTIKEVACKYFHLNELYIACIGKITVDELERIL